MEKNIDLFICPSEKNIIEAMKMIDLNTRGLLYVVDDAGALSGCITDGDIRRWIMNGGSLSDTVKSAMNTTPIFVPRESIEDSKEIMSSKEVTSVAVIDEDRHIVDVVFADPRDGAEKHGDALKDTPVIVMAGGKGTRLYPYTKILPKPLIPVGDVPILERIFSRFTKYGVDTFYLTVNYRKEMIRSYFAETTHDYGIRYIEEDEPLGTAGSIRLIEEDFDRPVVITNCDIIIDADYADILKHHIASGNDLTVVSSLKNTVIPYGVLYSDSNGIITDMEEKPELSHFINTGMYVMNPGFIKWIPEGRVYHMTDLAEEMIRNGKRVGMYPISENSFLDMGEFAEMKRMEERINAGYIE